MSYAALFAKYFRGQAYVELWQQIEAAYAEPHRHYHTMQHLNEMAAIFATEMEHLCALTPHEKQAFVLTIGLHDIVYQPERKDNEDISALWAYYELPKFGIEQAVIDKVVRWTIASKGHEIDYHQDLAGAMFLDADMRILAAEPARYTEYMHQVAAEFIPVAGEDAFTAGRSMFLQAYSDPDKKIFMTPYQSALEDVAKRNLAFELGVYKQGYTHAI